MLRRDGLRGRSLGAPPGGQGALSRGDDIPFPRPRLMRRVAAAALAAAFLTLFPVGTASAGATPVRAVQTDTWVVGWTSAMAWSPGGPAFNATVRQIVPLSVGGTAVRIEFSNQFGAIPMTVGAATVAVDLTGPEVVPGSLHALSFGGEPSVVIPPGGTATSDPLAFGVRAGEQLAVSAWVPGRADVTAHYDAGPMSYAANNAGNLTADTTGAGLTLPETWDRWVSAVEVGGTQSTGDATVFLGDSISDGFNPACVVDDCQLTDPWPEVLEARLRQLPPSERVSVVDESITANTLTVVTTPKAEQFRRGGGGPPGLLRLGQVLSLPGVNRLIVLLGTNDLWFGASAQQVIAGYQQLLTEAAAAHVGVIGVTLLPRAGSEGWTAQMELERQQVNHWILTSGQIPAVLDLAAVVADVYGGACQPARMYPPFDSGDHLHPNTAGQTAMANSIPTALLAAGAAPDVPPVVPTVPTTGCPHPPVLLVNSAFPSVSPPQTTSTPSTTSTTLTVPATAEAPAGPPVAGARPGHAPSDSVSGVLDGHLPGGRVGYEVAIGLLVLGVLVGALALRRRWRRRHRAPRF